MSNSRALRYRKLALQEPDKENAQLLQLLGLAVHQGTTFLTDHSISECFGHGDLIFRSAVALMRSHSTNSVMPGRFMTRRVSCAQNSLLP